MSRFRIGIAAAAGLVLSASVAPAQQDAPVAADPIEWSADAVVRFPGLGDFDVYERAVAIEVQYRNWFWSAHGVALAVGVEQWSPDAGSHDWAGRPEGDLRLLTAGLSWVGLLFESESNVWTIEAGVRFHLAQSDIRLRTGADRRKVDIGSGVTGLLALGYERRLTERVSLAAAISYRPDLLAGDADLEGAGALRDNKLESWGAHLGLRWRL